MVVRVFWGIFAAIVVIAIALACLVQPRFGAPPVQHIYKAYVDDSLSARTQNDLSITFDVASAANGQFGILVPSSFGPLDFELNGQKLVVEPARAHESVARYHTMALARIEGATLRQGTNQLIVTRSGIMKGLGLPDVYFGTWSTIEARADHQRAIVMWVDRMTLTMMVACMLLSLVMMFLSSRMVHYACLFAMFALLLGHDALNQIPSFKPFLLDIVTYIGLTFLMLSTLAFGYWINASKGERSIIFRAWGVAIGLVLGFDLVFGLNSPVSVPVRIAIFLIIGAGSLIWVIYRCFAAIPTLKVAGAITFAGLLVVSVSYGVAIFTVWSATDAQSRLFVLTTTNLVQFFGFITMIGSAAMFELGSYRSALMQLGRLDSIASRRVLETDLHARALRDQIQQVAVLEERERFTRDMHDGIGGHLLSLLLKARRGDLSSQVAEQDVSSAIADLRLITAALDTGYESLLMALWALKERADNQLTNAGFQLIWHDDSQLEQVKLDPRKVLEILRWAQEAVTNAVRHSKGTVVTIKAEFHAGQNLFTLKISDNGVGLSPTTQGRSGRGLANMAARAERLGGTQRVDNDYQGPGLSLSLVLNLAVLA